MTDPKRIQLRRTKGWRKPEGAIVVARPGPWGNPFRVVYGADLISLGPSEPDGGDGEWHVVDEHGHVCSAWQTKSIAAQAAVEHYRYRATEAPGHWDFVLWAIDTLRGRDLACWCPPDQPCHADVLLELANAEGSTKRLPMNRILWNTRDTDIDELVCHNATVHIEQMDDRCWWIGIDLPNDGYWAGNFHADSRGRMRFTQQETWGFDWDDDRSHDDPPKAKR